MKIILIIACLLITNRSISQNPIVQSILSEVKMDSLIYIIQQLSGEKQVVINGIPDTIFSRQYNQPGNEKAFQFAKQKFLSYGLQIDSLQFSGAGKNLFAVKTGSDCPNQKIIIGAHYDNIGNSIAPGADDNASGSSAVIEAARIFSNYNFPCTIVFALWDEEELGLIGSTAFAASNNDSIIGYINMDMLGWDSNNDSLADLHVRPVANSLQLADKAIEVITVYDIGLNLHIVNPGSGNTDHASFWNNGFTAIGINEEYDGDFNPYWHTVADSLAQFNLPFYEKCVKLVFATFAESAIMPCKYGITLFPNPVKDKLTLKVSLSTSAPILLEVFNTEGKLVKSVFMDNHSVKEIDINNMPSGVYIISIIQNGINLQNEKWIKYN